MSYTITFCLANVFSSFPNSGNRINVIPGIIFDNISVANISSAWNVPACVIQFASFMFFVIFTFFLPLFLFFSYFITI